MVKVICWHISSWSRAVFHLPDCSKLSSFYIVQFELGNFCCLPKQDWYFCQPHLIQFFFFSLLGISIWQQKLDFIVTERQEKSLFIEMKWRTCYMDSWSTALLKTWEAILMWMVGGTVLLMSVLLSLASVWFKQKREPNEIVGRASACAALTQGPGWALFTPGTSFLWA